MNRILSFANNKPNFWRFVVILFFGSYLVTGISVYRDYGVSWDEPASQYRGLVAISYVHQKLGSPLGSSLSVRPGEMMENEHRYHGVFFELPLAAGQFILGLTDSRAIYFYRHFCNFLLFWIATIVFWYLIREHYGNWLALAGVAFLILSPRLFAHSFYNPKDIPFLSLYIISTYTLVRTLTNKSVGWTIIHSAACGALIDIRIPGIFMPLITVALVFLDSSLGLPRRLGRAFIFTGSVMAFTILFWPLLWENPQQHFINSAKFLNNFPARIDMLFMGSLINSQQLPWYYHLVWIGVTTPIIYLGFCLSGFVKWASRIPILSWSDIRQEFLFVVFLTVLIPWGFVVIADSVSYNGWRHFYFIYPGLIVFSVSGLKWLYDKTSTKPLWNRLVLAVVLFALMKATFDIISFHPYQHEYFNLLAGRDERSNFEGDYWGLAFREGLETIGKEPSDSLFIHSKLGYPAVANRAILDKALRNRVHIVPFQQADYVLVSIKETQRARFMNTFDTSEFEMLCSVPSSQYSLLDIYKRKSADPE